MPPKKSHSLLAGCLLAGLIVLFPFNAEAKKVLYVFLDLDGYIVNEVHGRLLDARADRVVSTPGAKWRFSDGVGEFLQAGAELRGWEVRFSFFSNRDEQRNVAVAKAIVLPNKKTAFEAMGGRIFSTDHLVEVEVEGRTARRKDLAAVGKGLPDFVLENSLIIDNELRYAVDGQRDHMLQVPHTSYFYEHFTSFFDPKVAPLSADEIPDSVRAFLAYRNVMAYSLGMLDEALELAETEKLSPPKALARLQWNEVTKKAFFDPLRSIHHDTRFYRRGGKLLRTVAPDYKLLSLEASWPIPCKDRLKLVDWEKLSAL